MQGMTRVDINVGHIFCGLGGGAKGFNRGQARVGNLEARFKCLGGIDNDPASVRDFQRLAGVRGTCLDLFDRDQYRAFHGQEPPDDWREAVPDDVRRAFGNKHPHILFLSAPCKGFSGLLSELLSTSARYQALNRLTLRGVFLALEAYRDDPVELIVFENVPRIATRGRALLDQIVALLRAYGYAVAETTHDCGEMGNLAQSRKRFLLVARYMAKVPNYLYEPVKRPLRGVGEVLSRLPVPFQGSEAWNPMHRMPALHWKTWVRLAFVEAGSDWRSLNKLNVADGVLKDYGIAPEADWHSGVYGVNPWEEPIGTVTSRSAPSNGSFAIADPRIDGHAKSVQLGVRAWESPSAVVTGKMFVGGGPNAVADPRIAGARFNNTFRIVPWGATSPAVAGPGGPAGGLAVADPRASDRADYKQTKYRVTSFDEASGAVIAASSTGNGAYCVADPRGYGPSTHHHCLKVTQWDEPGGTVTTSKSPGSGALSVADPRTAYGPNAHRNKLSVMGWDDPSRTVTGATQVQGGGLSVADPRPAAFRDGRAHYITGGHYGVTEWDAPAGAVTGHPKNNNGPWSVADPRPDTLVFDPESTSHFNGPTPQVLLPAPNDRLACIIRALDGTWHRPFTTLELAALQGLVDLEDELSLAAWDITGPGFQLDGVSDSAWRERIGNAVPPPSATAIASVMGRVLLGAWSGETFALSSEPIWVQPIAGALMAAG